jgi:hypothetical protein
MGADDACFKCFMCFRLMFQVFYLNVANVDMGLWNIAYVAMATYACCKLFFNCFMCFRHLFQMFHLDVSKVDLVVHKLQWLYTHVSSVSSVFTHMLHMFHLDVSKVDRVLHDAGGQRRAACCRASAPISHLPYAAHLTLSSPLLSLPYLPFPPSRRGSSSST